MGKVIKLVSSSDSSIRSAKIKMPSGKVFGRPLNLLFPIEVSGRNDSPTEKGKPTKECSEERGLPPRKAATAAKENIKRCLRN